MSTIATVTKSTGLAKSGEGVRQLAMRLERARQSLEEASDPVELVAAQCGFGTPETMRRAFARRVGSSPAEYRSRFRRKPTPVA